MSIRRRGGAREGAGRRPILSDEQRLKIGAAIHRRLWRKTQAEFVRSVEAKFGDDNLRALWASLEATPRAGRRKVDPEALADHLADIQAEIEEGGLQGRRYFRGPTRVAPGIRGPIIRSVARAASRLLRASVSERTVERCLEEYRAIEARVTSELGTYAPDIESDSSDEI